MGTEFNKDQFDAIYPEGIENHYWTLSRNMILEKIISKDAASADILEVGCGKGVVVKYLRDRGFKVRGVELAELPIETELKPFVKAGTDVFALDTQEYKDVSVVMLLDVIEHIEFPKQFLSSIKEKFPSLKSFIIMVPARQELFSNYDTFNGHFRRYNQELLKGEFADMSSKKITCSYFFHGLYLPAKVLLGTKGKRDEKIIAPKGILSTFIHRILASAFFMEYNLLPKKWKGTSLVLKIDLN